MGADAAAVDREEQRWEELAPRRIGRYTLFYEIGSGGMASVYLAREVGPAGFERWVAIKRVHPHLAREARFVDMFLDEARLVARINHPNVTQVLELGEADGTWFLAMEYLHGETLSALARALWRGGDGLPWPVCVRIIAQACEGLHQAHELCDDAGQPLRLVHRDVSPQNLLVTYGGIVKVMDFGIAKAVGQIAQTSSGSLKGKVSYMSPEQARGQPVDRRSDVFALGIVLWELTTGRRLFKGDSELDSLRRVAEAEVAAPAAAGARIPQPLERTIVRALQRDPAERFATAAEMQRELESLLASRGYVVGATELAELMRRTFADRIRIREGLLRSTKVPRGPETPAVEVGSGETLTFESGVRSPRPAARARSLGLAALGGAAALALVLLAGFWLFSPDRSTPGPPVTPPPVVASPAPAPPAPASSAPAPPAAAVLPVPPPSAVSPPASPDTAVEAGAPADPEPPERTASPPEGPAEPARRTASQPPARGRPSPRRERETRPPAIAPPAAATEPGFLNVMTTPWSEVELDGARIGPTPIVRRSLPPGPHRVRLVWADGRSRVELVVVRSGESTSLRRAPP